MGSLLSSQHGDNYNQTNALTQANPGSNLTTNDAISGLGGGNSDSRQSSNTAFKMNSITTDPLASNTGPEILSAVNETLPNFAFGYETNSTDFRVILFGNPYYPFTLPTLPQLYSWLGFLSSTAMVVGCVMPYVPQYLTIHKARNSSGFSTFVCLTLLIANISRIVFWFGHPFELPLIIQACLQIITQILLLELCVRIKNETVRPKRKNLLNAGIKQFWRWTDLTSYLAFLTIFTVSLGVAMSLFIDNKPFVETVGFCALVSESFLGLPQVIKNHRNKSTEGMSLSMVLMWLGGDAFKTGYFIANDVPIQFWLCGISQITIDIIILFQVCLFRQNAPTKKGSRQVEMMIRSNN